MDLKILHLYIAHILLLLFNRAFFPSATVCVGPGDVEMMLLNLLIILFCCVKVLLTYTNSFILQSASFKLSASSVPDFLSLTTDCQCFKTADMGIYDCDLNLTPGSILNWTVCLTMSEWSHNWKKKSLVDFQLTVVLGLKIFTTKHFFGG